MKLIHRVFSLFTQSMLLLLLTTACVPTTFGVFVATAMGSECKITDVVEQIRSGTPSEVTNLIFTVAIKANKSYPKYPISFVPRGGNLIKTCDDRFKTFTVSPLLDMRGNTANIPITFGNSGQFASFKIYLPIDDQEYEQTSYATIAGYRHDIYRGQQVHGKMSAVEIKVEYKSIIYGYNARSTDGSASQRYWFVDDNVPAVLLCAKSCYEELLDLTQTDMQDEPGYVDEQQLPITIIYEGANIPIKNLTCEEELALVAKNEVMILRHKHRRVLQNGEPKLDCVNRTITIPVKLKPKKAGAVRTNIKTHNGKPLKTSCQPMLRYYAIANPGTGTTPTREITLTLQSGEFVVDEANDIDLATEGELQLAFTNDSDCMFNTTDRTKIFVSDVKEDGSLSFDVTAYPNKPSLHVVLALGGIPTTMITDDDMSKLVEAILNGLGPALDKYADVNLYLDREFADTSLQPYEVFNTDNRIPPQPQLVDLISKILTSRSTNSVIFDTRINLSPFITSVSNKAPMKPPVFLFIGRRETASNGICVDLSVLNSIENKPSKPRTIIVEFYNSNKRELGAFYDTTNGIPVSGTSAPPKLKPMPSEYGYFPLFQCDDIKSTDSLQPFIVNWDSRNLLNWPTQATQAISALIIKLFPTN